MTHALRPFFGDVEVSSVQMTLRDDGTNRRARFAIAYSRGAGPATVFLKAADPQHAEMNLATGGLFNEPGFSRQI